MGLKIGIWIYLLFVCSGVFAQTTPTFQVKTIAALQAVPIYNTNNLTALVTGTSAAYAGGGRMFFYDANSSATTNTFSVIKPNGSGGRWISQFNGGIDFPNDVTARFHAVGGDPDFTIKGSTSNYFQFRGVLDVQGSGTHQINATGGDNALQIMQTSSVGQSAIDFWSSDGVSRAAMGYGNIRTNGNFWYQVAYVEMGDYAGRLDHPTDFIVVNSQGATNQFGVFLQYRMQFWGNNGQIKMFGAYDTNSAFSLNPTNRAIGIGLDSASLARLHLNNTNGALIGSIFYQGTNGFPAMIVSNAPASTLSSSDGLVKVHQQGTTATSPALVLRQDGSGPIINASSNSVLYMTLLNNGKLGLGLSNPTELLDVVPQTTTDAALALLHNAGGTFYIGRNDSAGSRVAGVAYADVIWDVSNNPIVIGTGNAKRVTLDTSGNVQIETLGGGLRIKEGSNGRMGIAVLDGGTPAAVTVNNTSVTASTRVFLTVQNAGGLFGSVVVSARTAATSFTITSSLAADTNSVAWMLVEPSP